MPEFRALLGNVTTHKIFLHNTLMVPTLRVSVMSCGRMMEAATVKHGDVQGTRNMVDTKTRLESILSGGLEIIRIPPIIGTLCVKHVHRKPAD